MTLIITNFNKIVICYTGSESKRHTFLYTIKFFDAGEFICKNNTSFIAVFFNQMYSSKRDYRYASYWKTLVIIKMNIMNNYTIIIQAGDYNLRIDVTEIRNYFGLHLHLYERKMLRNMHFHPYKKQGMQPS